MNNNQNNKLPTDMESILDTLSTEKWDLIEKNKSLEQEITDLKLRLNQSLSQLDGAKSTIDRLNVYIQGEEWKNHRSVKAAEDEAKRIENNNNHAKSVIDQLSKTLDFARKKLEETTISEDHLAKKTIELYNENQKLTSQITDLISKLEPSKKDNTPPITVDSEELKKYKSLYTDLGHAIFRIISSNPITKPFKIYNLYNELYNYFRK